MEAILLLHKQCHKKPYKKLDIYSNTPFFVQAKKKIGNSNILRNFIFILQIFFCISLNLNFTKNILYRAMQIKKEIEKNDSFLY